MKKLSKDELRNWCDINELDFKTTAELEPLDGIIGQNRAVKAMNFGLQLKNKGYNIYLSGITGTGKTSYAKSILQKIALEENAPDDWCYVYNFDDTERPIAISFSAGVGEQFVFDMAKLIDRLKTKIPELFNSEEFENRKRDIWEEYQKQTNEILHELEEYANERSFAIQKSSKGIYLVPIINGEPMDDDKLQSLPKEITQKIQEKLPEVQKELDKTLRKIKALEKKAIEETEKVEKKLVLLLVKPHIQTLISKYTEIEKAVKYLEDVQKDIIKNLDEFKGNNNENNPFNSLITDRKKDFLNRYKVNLFINNSKNHGLPVIIETNPTYYNLFGKIEGKPQLGTIVTDFTDIKNGSVHRANGGYLIIQANDILKEPIAWYTLKRVLQNQEAYIENIGEQFKLFPITTIKPEPIPVNLKVILIGSPQIKNILYQYDEDFRKLFKIVASFDTEMERSNENIKMYSKFVSSLCGKEKLMHFDRSGISKLIEFSSRIAKDKKSFQHVLILLQR